MARWSVVGVDLIGLPEFQAGMRKLIKKAPHFAFNAMKKGATAIVAQAKENAPVKTGALRDSLRILSEDKKRLEIVIGSLLNYAYWQEVGHSNMEGKWFFTSAIETVRPRFKSIVNSEITMLRFGSS